MNVARNILNVNKNFPLHLNVTLKHVILRNYAFKSDLKIKWVRPEKIPCYKPEKSGDLESIPEIDKSQYLLDFRKSKELETADENVQKLFTLEFAPRKYANRCYFHNIIDKVKRHEYDVGSAEVKIAKWTGIIRAWQEIMERFPHNRKLKVKLKELIDQRKKQLKYLRRWDYKRFEWVLETLNIVYKSPPTEFHWVTRKESLQKLTNKYCDDIKQKQLDAYRLQLESEQPAFLEEKLRALEFIREEQADCGVNVTVTQEEIEEIRRRLEELRNKNNVNDE